jgi:hypothetical protein
VTFGDCAVRNNPFLPPIGTSLWLARVVPQFSSGGQTYEFTLDYTTPSPIGAASDLLSLINSWLTANKALMLACLPPTVSLVNVLGVDLNPGSTVTQQSLVVGGVGTAGAAALPGTSAVVVTKQTAWKGQHGRGRFYMPSIPTTFTTPATDPSILNSTGLVAYTTWMATLIANVVGTVVWTPVVSQRPVPPQVLPQYASKVVTLRVQPVLGTVRRRREGRGI